MAVQLDELGVTSEITREIAWLELALDLKDKDERKRFVLVEELFGKQLMVATDRTRLHIGMKYAKNFPIGWIPRGDEYLPPENYFRYEEIMEDSGGTKIIVSRELLDSHLNKLLTIMPKQSERKVVTLSFKPNKMIVSAYSPTRGKIEYELPCNTDKQPKQLRMNLVHMVDAMNGSEAKTIILQQSKERAEHEFMSMQLGQGRIAFLASGW